MQRKTIIRLSVFAVAAALALLTRRSVHLPANFPAFAFDDALLAHREFQIAVIGWLLFSVYWELTAGNAAPEKSSESPGSRGLHVFLVNVAALLVLVPFRGLGRFLPLSSFIMSIGLTVEAVGLFLCFWARRHLGRNWSGKITIKIDHQLIRSGPYRLLRHPIYTGILAIYTGTTIVTGEWLAIIGLIMTALAYWRKIRLEEVNLKVAFGADYEAYCRQTWALVPGLL